MALSAIVFQSWLTALVKGLLQTYTKNHMNNAGAIYLQHRNVIFSVQMCLKFVRTGKKITLALKGHDLMLSAFFDTGLGGEKTPKIYSALAGLITLTYYF